MSNSQRVEAIGIYMHIPFCSYLCHYCDFAKTARWDEGVVDQYFSMLEEQIKWSLSELKQLYVIKSINIGGGTPSLFTQQYSKLIDLLRPYCIEDCEISLEANPNDISKQRLQEWRNIGFNRISLGVQTFDASGLNFLKRDHSAAMALKSSELALNFFENCNLDFIYSWPSQTLEQWQKDLEQAIKMGVTHLSLYNLTYAAKTPIGRAHSRGLIKEPEDSTQEAFYACAREKLASDYTHDEVSNWSKPGFSCIHNWLYWQDGYYVGFGTGAHGYLPSKQFPLGIRYSTASSLKRFLSVRVGGKKNEGANFEPWAHFLTSINACVEERDKTTWLIEYVGSALRSSKGVDCSYIEEKVNQKFTIDSCLLSAINRGQVIVENNKIYLSCEEWFRETYWCLKVLDCFNAQL